MFNLDWKEWKNIIRWIENVTKLWQKALALSSYCAAQARLLQLYDSNYDDIAMLQEINPTVTKALQKRKRRNLRRLEQLSETLAQRIQRLETENPDISSSSEAQDLTQVWEEKRQEYERL